MKGRKMCIRKKFIYNLFLERQSASSTKEELELSVMRKKVFIKFFLFWLVEERRKLLIRIFLTIN
jgi:hypothetical protein